MVESNDASRSFFGTFITSSGAKEIIIVSTVVSFGMGCVIGLIPATIADRLAHLHHGFDGDCATYKHKPDACIAGSEEAQEMATISNFCSNILTLFFNPVLGSKSDSMGRRPVILLSLFLSLLPSLSFLALVKIPTMSPIFYYVRRRGLIISFTYLTETCIAFTLLDRCCQLSEYYFCILVGYYA